MNIVQINADYNRGSIGRTTSEIHNTLLSRGYNSYVFSSEVSDKTNYVYRIGNVVDHKIHAILSRLTGLQGYFSIISTIKLIRHLRRIRPDVVHLRNLHANYVHVPLLLNYLANNDIHTIITLHDCWFLTGHCCYYTHINCSKWKENCYACPAMRMDNISWFFDTSSFSHRHKKKLLNSISKLTIVGNSKWTTLQARLSSIKREAKILHIYNWIDTTVFHTVDYSDIDSMYSLHSKFVILGVANGWNDRKGLCVFEELSLKLPNYTFILVGNMPYNRCVSKNIIKISTTNSTYELCKFYSRANVFLNLSLQETFGKVAAEALSCGTPVIANNATANPEIIGPGCGYVINNNNIDEIISCIELIKQNEKSFYSNKCIEYVKSNFNKENIINDYIKLYKTI